jgi:chromate reductase, NAD(P)H dehydrogenase (quinone)
MVIYYMVNKIIYICQKFKIMTKTIFALAGSNSKHSINQKLVDYTVEKLNEFEILNINLNDYELPLYGSDFHAEHGIPDTAKALFEKLKSSDAVVLSLAEHNGSYTTAFKNAFDWLSVINSKLWGEKPMLLMATSPGARGGQSVLEAASSRFPFMGANIEAEFSLPNFEDNFSDGKIIETELDKEHSQAVNHFKAAL